MDKRSWWEFEAWNWIHYKMQWIFSWDKIKNEVEQLLLKYKHGYDIHEHGKQRKWMNHIKLFLTCHNEI